MDAETFIQLMFYIFIAPFWLAWKSLKLLWEFVAKPLLEKRADHSASKHSEAIASQHEDKKRAREEARAAQLAALQAAVPQSLPDKLRATIQINEFKEGVSEQQQIHRLFVEDSWITVETRERIRFAVDMIIELPEVDRALMKKHGIYDILLEDEPEFTPAQLRQIERQDQERMEAAKDPYYKAVMDDTVQLAQEMLKGRRRETRIGDYLVAPFTRAFDTAHEAKLYADKLKSKILPQIKQHLDLYREHKQSETVEF